MKYDGIKFRIGSVMEYGLITGIDIAIENEMESESGM